MRRDMRNKLSISKEAYVFGFVGRMGRDKGSKELLSSFRKMRQNGSDSFLCLVGSNEMNDEIPTELVNWAQNDSNVIITGNLPNEELPSYYAGFDCYVHPTYREGLGMVLQEAGAMGNAIITTRVPGASEVMVENESCVLVDKMNVDALYDAMLCLSNDRQRTEILGEAAYKRTARLYESGIMVKNICEDIESVLGA
jgi:glycosyltransferase involved in cell wall biosynthesis